MRISMSRIWTGNNRASWHDYTSRCIYHLTLMKHPEAPAFGMLAGDCHLPIGSPGSSHIHASKIGIAIKQSLRHISDIHPALRLFQYALMPDHLHIILSVEDKLDDIVGRKIAIYKVSVNHRVGIDHIFDRGFNDQILTKSRKLDIIYNYLRSNPYRLAIRRTYPDFSTRYSNLIIGDTICQLYGNIHLLDNPFKDQVIVHRADDDQTFLSNRDRWLHTATNGGVLVSPFISQREKSIRKEVELSGGRLIIITNRPFGEREKPFGKDFELCVQGRLLIIAPKIPMHLDRAACLKMNALAKTIANGI